jgi:gas vesicle structural protein
MSDVDLMHDVTLLDLVDRLLSEGVVLTGDITIGVAGVDLIYLGLRAVLSSVDTIEQKRSDKQLQPAPSQT